MKITKNDIYRKGLPVLKCNYCVMQSLLTFHEIQGYNVGKCGWNFDAYNVYGVMICTGYRNMPGRKMLGIREYEEKAREILLSEKDQYEKMQLIESLLYKLCDLNKGNN